MQDQRLRWMRNGSERYGPSASIRLLGVSQHTSFSRSLSRRKAALPFNKHDEQAEVPISRLSSLAYESG